LDFGCDNKNFHHHRIEGISTQHKALIIAGVHGSELSGVEVVEKWLFELLSNTKPFFTVEIVPRVFEENCNNAALKMPKRKPGDDSNEFREVSDKTEKGGENYPNRNFPAPGVSLAMAIKFHAPDPPKDCGNRKIMKENICLIDLINTFKPQRIASVHAHRFPAAPRPALPTHYGKKGLPGFFADPVAKPLYGPLPEKPSICAPKGLPPPVPSRYVEFTEDDVLALEMAKFVRKKQNEYEKEHVVIKKSKDMNFIFNDWVAGNWLDYRGILIDVPQTRYPEDKQAAKKGYSLGSWAPCKIDEDGGLENRPGIPVITVEVRHYEPTTLDYYKKEDRKESKMKREAELRAYAEALLKVFLGNPASLPKLKHMQ
jgi:hypothetical protein